MKNFIDKYFNNDEYFFISFINHSDNRDIQNYLHNKESFNKFYEKFLYKNKKQSMYFTFNTFKKDSKQKIKLNVEKLKSIIFDFDDVENSKKDLEILMKCFPNYFYILNTSDLKYQICYKFENDASIDFDEFEKIHFTLSNYFKSDKNICSIEKLSRFPKSINKKNDFETKMFYNKNKNTTELIEFINFINENNIELLEKPSKNKNTELKEINSLESSSSKLSKSNVSSFAKNSLTLQIDQLLSQFYDQSNFDAESILSINQAIHSTGNTTVSLATGNLNLTNSSIDVIRNVVNQSQGLFELNVDNPSMTVAGKSSLSNFIENIMQFNNGDYESMLQSIALYQSNINNDN